MVRRGRRGGYGYGGNQPADPETGFFGGIEMVLKVEGVHGDCDLPGYEGWIPILAWSFGMSRGIGRPQVPTSARKAKAEEKKAILIAAGLDPEKAPANDGYGGFGGYGRRDDGDDDTAKYEEALKDFDENSNLQFNDADIPPRKLPKPNLQDISMTKYCGLDSAQLYAMVLAQKKGVEVQLKCLKAKAKKKPEEDKMDDSASSSSAEKAEKKKKTNEDGVEEEEEVEREYVVMQEFTFCDAFITSISTGGSGGEDRFTENMTINFSTWQFRIVDYLAKPPAEQKVGGAAFAPPEASIIHDPLRNIVKPYKAAVKNELDKNDQLQPCSSVVLGYL